jgi:hypothetical protein
LFRLSCKINLIFVFLADLLWIFHFVKQLRKKTKIHAFKTKKAIPNRGQSYKTFYGRKLRLFVISWSVCPWQTFSLRSIKHSSLVWKYVNHGQIFYNICPWRCLTVKNALAYYAGVWETAVKVLTFNPGSGGPKCNTVERQAFQRDHHAGGDDQGPML